MKKIFLAFFRFIFTYINFPVKIRDFIMWPVASRVLGLNFNDPINMSNGLVMKTDLKDILGRMVLFFGPSKKYLWEPQTSKVMEKIIKESDNIIIAGSHIGFFTIYLAGLFKNIKIFTYEPINYLYNISKENIEMNELGKRVFLSDKALSDQDGSALISINNIKSSLVDAKNRKHSTQVKTTKFDTENKGLDINFILLDVEGNEYKALLGMERTLARNVTKNIIFEITSNNFNNSQNIFNFLSKYNYDFWVIEDDYDIKMRDLGKPVLTEIMSSNDLKDLNNKYINVLATKLGREELKELGLNIKP